MYWDMAQHIKELEKRRKQHLRRLAYEEYLAKKKAEEESQQQEVQQEQQQLHPVQETVLRFVNEAFTIEEAKARAEFIHRYAAGLLQEVEQVIAQKNAPEATDEAGAPVEVEQLN